MSPRPPQPLRIVLLAEFVRALPAASSAWVALLARELSARGHRVTIVADGIEDPHAFGDLPVVVHRHGRIHHGCEPFGFRRWARRVISSIRPDVTLSLTDHVAADLWLPLGPGPGAFLRGLRHTSLVGAAMDIAHRPYILLEVMSQQIARREAKTIHTVRTCFATDPASKSLPMGSLILPPASTLTPTTTAARLATRESIRRSLSLAASTPLFLLSVSDHELEHLDLLFEATAQLRAHSAAGPRFLLAARTPTRIRQCAARWSVADAIIAAGTTRRPDLLACAADALVHPCPARKGESSGRLIADALAMGLPVLTDATSPGADLISPGAGVRLHAPTASAWRDALLHACDPAWRSRASAAALASAPPLSALIDTLEVALLNAAHARAVQMAPVTTTRARPTATV